MKHHLACINVLLISLLTSCGASDSASPKSVDGVGPATQVVEQFNKSFKNHYEARQCFENTRRFLSSVVSPTVEQWYLVSVENKGFTTFGMVNAEKTRNGSGVPEEKNWYHHVFALDKRGFVFDLDFTNSPRVVSLKTYLDEMFLDEDECGSPPRLGEFCVGSERKLNDYEFTVQRADYALNKKIDPKQLKISMKEFRDLPSYP